MTRMPSINRLVVSTAMAVSLSACASLPQSQAIAPIRDVASYAAADSFAAPAAQWPSDAWWTDFHDAQLTGLIEEGLKGATDMRVAQARLARAQAAITSANAVLLPSVTAQGGATVAKQSGNYLSPTGFGPQGWQDYGQANVGLNLDLDFWGKNRAALTAAKLDARAAEAEAAAARLTVSTGIAQAYADLTSLFDERDSAAEALRNRTKTAELIATRQQLGLENMGAVERARSSEANARAELAAIDETIGLTRNRIAALIGAGPDRGLAIARPTLRSDAAFGLPENLGADLLGRRPDVIASRLRSEAAATRIKQAKAGFYPNVNLSAMIGFQALGLGNLFNSGSTYGSAGPALSLPIFEGGKLRAQYRGAEAEYAEAVAAYDGTLANALREVADAATSTRALTARLANAQQAAASARAAWVVANNRYKGGLATYLDVLTAEDQLIATDRAVAALTARSFSLRFSLIRALGGGFQS